MDTRSLGEVSMKLWAVCLLCFVADIAPSTVKSGVHIRIGARPSTLAQIQARTVLAAMESSAESDISIRFQTSIHKIQAKSDHLDAAKAGIQAFSLAAGAVDFTSALDDALLSNEIDVAVHSLKDIPPAARWKRGLLIAAHLRREDPRDVLVGPYETVNTLPLNAKVGTSSARRQAQLLALRPDLMLVNLRGNVETRLHAIKDGKVDALVLAQAGLNRLLNEHSNSGELSSWSEVLGFKQDQAWHRPITSCDMLGCACQGIVAVVCRANDARTCDLVKKFGNRDAAVAAAAERSFLEILDTFSPSSVSAPWAGRPPLAALMERRASNCDEWVFHGLLATPDGSRIMREERTVKDQTLSVEEAARLGTCVAEEILLQAGPDFYKL
jgi:hydroxymethylbilane synthase